MSTGTEQQTAPPPSRGEVARDTFIKGLEEAGQLAPGAADWIRQNFQARGGPSDVASAMVEFLGSEWGKRALSPDSQGAPGNLRAVAAMFSQVAPEKRQQLADALHIELGHLPPHKQAEAIAKKFDDRSFAERWCAEPPAPPVWESRLADVLKKHFDDITDPDSRRNIARQLGLELAGAGNRSEAEIVAKVAQWFSRPGSGARFGTGEIQPGDDRLTADRRAERSEVPAGHRYL